MIKIRNEDVTDRVVQSLLDDPVGVGGWWNYFEGIVMKYGVVPVSDVPATSHSDNTGPVNALLNTLMRGPPRISGVSLPKARSSTPCANTKRPCSAMSTYCWWPASVSRRESSYSDGKRKSVIQQKS